VDDGDGACVVETGAASSSGADYGGMAVEDVSVTVADDDTAGVVVAPTSLEISEPEGTEFFSITLTSKPIATVVFDISADAQTTVSPTQLAFTDLNWNVQQSVAVTVVDDDIAEGRHSSTIHPVASSDDGYYAGDALGGVTVIISDNETAGLVVTPPQIQVAEGGVPQSYEVVLASQPTDTVTISLTTDGQTIVTPTLLTFLESEWSVPRVVTVTAVDDEDPEGSHASTISHSGNSRDRSYHGNPMGVVNSRVTDNDKEARDRAGQAELAALTSRLSDTVAGITKGEIRISPPLVLVILLVVVASVVELVFGRRRH
jgi:hypothetical protein